MTPTVDERRNEIREAVGRFERDVSTAFTKEALAAICEAVDADIPLEPMPSKQRMRAAILARIEGVDEESVDGADSPFRKGELDAVAAALANE